MSPAVSKKQQMAMGIAHAIQGGKMKAKPGTPSAEMAATMKPSDVTDFASTPQAGLPKKVGGPGAGRPPKGPKDLKVINVGKPVKKMKFM